MSSFQELLPGFTCWISFAPLFSFIYCWVLIFALSPFYILIYIDDTLIKLGSFMQTEHLCFLIHIWTKREVGAPFDRLKPSSKIFYWPFQGGASFVDHLCYFCIVLLCFHARLFVDALWSTVGKGLTSWLSIVMCICDVFTFQLVSWVRCGAWLYRFLIFALFLTLLPFNSLCFNEKITHNFCVDINSLSNLLANYEKWWLKYSNLNKVFWLLCRCYRLREIS